MSNVIKVENLSKAYQLGQIGTGTLSRDIERWWALKRGKEDPFLKIGEANDRTAKGTSNVVWSLKDINFEIKQGDAVGIIGRNGAGKSTLLKILSRVTAPSTGRIKVKGRIASLLEVGTGFHPELTGKENIFLNGAILGMRKKEIQKKFDEIVDFAGIERYVDTPVKRYSSGMYVRLAFAVAAHLESEILIVDEVLAVGDAEFQQKCLGKMGEVSKGEGRTVLFVSHNMAAVQNLCGRSFLMAQGEMVYHGLTSDVLNYYLGTLKEESKKESLGERSNRSGNGMIKIVDFFVEDNSGKKIETMISGMTVTFVFRYECPKPENIRVADMGLSIHQNDFEILTIIYSSYTGKVYTNIQTSGEFRITIENFPFTQGSYSIGALLLADGVVADWPEGEVAKICVEDGDFYNTGRVSSFGKAPFLIDGKWS